MENELLSEDFNTLLVIPSLITTLSIFLVVSFKKWRAVLGGSALISGLTISLLILNIIEFLTYGNILKNHDLSLKAYYCVSAASASIFLCLSERLNSPQIIPRKAFYLSLILLNILFTTYILFSDQIIDGAIRTSYTISRIPGDYYWAFQLFIVSCHFFAPLFILKSILSAKNPLDKKRNKVVLFSFIPISFTVLQILLLMQLGFQINLSIFFPLSTLVFVVVYLFTENKDDLFKFLVNIPFSPERSAYKQVNNRVIEYIAKTQTDEKISLKELMNEIEKTFITNALEIKDGNHNLAAELLSTSISTIYRNKERDANQ